MSNTCNNQIRCTNKNESVRGQISLLCSRCVYLELISAMTAQLSYSFLRGRCNRNTKSYATAKKNRIGNIEGLDLLFLYQPIPIVEKQSYKG